jgi:hypothetical protein
MVTALRWMVAAGIVALTAASRPASAGSAATGSPAASAASSVDRYESDWAHRVRPWQRRTVVSISVDRSGLGELERKSAGEPEPCTTFRPSEAQIRHFIARAKRISQRDFLHETDWSPCHAMGRVQFEGGGRAEWMVQRLGAGFVSIAGARHYLHCEDCALGPVGQAGTR